MKKVLTFIIKNDYCKNKNIESESELIAKNLKCYPFNWGVVILMIIAISRNCHDYK